MLEKIIGAKSGERKPWELFFIGLLYAGLSFFLVRWIFGADAVLSKYSGVLMVTFTVMFSLPFVYSVLRFEEYKDTKIQSSFRLLSEHKRAIMAFMWLFLGFVVAYALLYIIFSSAGTFSAQVETFCLINRPTDHIACAEQYGIKSKPKTTASVTGTERLFLIITNNLYVLIFTLIFSLIFGAGAIFILAWNASVIAAAIGIFTKMELSALPLGLARYMIHGLPEIAAYFVAALAGGIISVAVVNHDTQSERFWNIIKDSLNLLGVAMIILIIAGIIEVYVTPVLF
ncbi:MAG: stage II sporulation protein M [Nanoarchaeota archaeon]